MEKVFKKSLLVSLVVFLETIMIFTLFTILLEYFLIYKTCRIENNLGGNSKTFILLLILCLVFFFNIFFKKIADNLNLKFIIILIALWTSFIVLNKKTHSFFTQKGQEVKICSLSTSWGIQGKEIIIYGKNFSPEWQPGKVFVDDFQLLVKKWTENKIIVEQPVPTRYFKGGLFVINQDNTKSNSKPFEVRDPSSISKIENYVNRLKFLKF